MTERQATEGSKSLGKPKRFVSPQRSFLNKADEPNTVGRRYGRDGSEEIGTSTTFHTTTVQGQVFKIMNDS